MEPVHTIYNIANANFQGQCEGLPDGTNTFRINFEDLEFGPEIGKGAYGKIFKGEYFGTPVGIKEISLSPNNVHFQDVVKFTQREVAMLRFSHPHLVQLIGVSEKGQNLYIITEFVSGGDLGYYLFKNKNEENAESFIHRKVNIGSSSTPDLDTTGERLVDLSWPLRIKIAYDVACAMSYLHSRNVIHRDLKSTNLLVGESWKIKVCDFGFARTDGLGAGRLKRTMTICGTNNWMAPEVLLGQDYNQSIDVFSFGIVLSEIITRLEIHSQMRPISLKYGIDFDFLLTLIPKDCPPPFLKLMVDCTEYDPDIRPTFKEITERLKSLTRKMAVPAILPPLRVLAPTPVNSPLTSPRVSRKVAQSPISIGGEDLESDLDSDDETEDSLDDMSSCSSLSRSSSCSSSSSKHPYGQQRKMGYIIKHINIGSSDHDNNSGRSLSPISFSPSPSPLFFSNITPSNIINNNGHHNHHNNLKSPPPPQKPPKDQSPLRNINSNSNNNNNQIDISSSYSTLSSSSSNTTSSSNSSSPTSNSFQPITSIISQQQYLHNISEEDDKEIIDELSKSLQNSIWTPVSTSTSTSRSVPS